MQTFQANGFSSVIPPGWQDRSVITLAGPTSEDGFMANITIIRRSLKAGVDVRQFGAVAIKGLEEEREGIKVLHQTLADASGQKVIRRLHTLPIDDRVIKQAQLYLVLPPIETPTGLVITCSASLEAFDSLLPQFEIFLNGFAPTPA